MLLMLASAAVFAMADRFSGSGVLAQLQLPGRPIYYAAPIVLLFGLWAGFLLSALMWVLWRLPSWDFKVGKVAALPHARIDPRTRLELTETYIRHLPLGAPALFGHPWTVLAPLAAVGLAYWLARQADKGRDVNWVVETARGAAFGLLLAL